MVNCIATIITFLITCWLWLFVLGIPFALIIHWLDRNYSNSDSQTTPEEMLLTPAASADRLRRY